MKEVKPLFGVIPLVAVFCSALVSHADSVSNYFLCYTPNLTEFSFSERNGMVLFVIMSTNHSFIFQGSCNNAYPEETNNLAYKLLLSGSAGTIAATRDSISPAFSYPWEYWQIVGVPQMAVCISRAIVVDGLSMGDALQLYRFTESPSTAMKWQNWIVFNLYGDPSIGLRSIRFAGPLWSF